MEIRVEELVRTKNGLIGKVNKIELAGSGVRFGGEYLSDTIIQFNDGKVYERRVKEIDKQIKDKNKDYYKCKENIAIMQTLAYCRDKFEGLLEEK